MCKMCSSIANIFFAITVIVLGATAEVTDKQYAQMPNLFELDDFDRCMYAYGSETLYCMITFQLNPEDPKDPSEVWNIINETSSDPSNYRHDLIRHGVCIPQTCPNMTSSLAPNNPEVRDHVEECYNRKYKHLGLRGRITELTCQNQESPYPIDYLDIIVGVCLVTYVIFVICCSLYEGIARYKTKEEYDRITGTTFGRYVSSFSIPKNWLRLKHIDMDNPDVRRMRSIQGVRFYNMCLVILTHTVMGNLGAPVSNPRFTETMTDKIFNLFLANGGYAVQTFFMFSGWMLSYHFFVTFEDKKEVKPKYLMLAFLNRYIRLTPTLAVVIALHATWLVRIQRGPFWEAIVGKEYTRCRSYGWTNLLYINTLVGEKFMCLQPSWYLATDMHLHFLSLIVMAVIVKHQNRMKYILGTTMLIGALIPATIAYVKNYDIIVRQYPESLYAFLLTVEHWHVLFASSYTNIPGYIVGIMIGYLYYKHRNTSLKMSKISVTLWWIGGILIPIFVVLVGWVMYRKDYTFTKFESAAYWGLGRIVFATGIGFFVLGFTLKIGWFARWACEWHSIQVLSRLTYCAYLVHWGLIQIRVGALQSPNYNTNYLICLCQTWYMAVDTQFFLTGLFVVILMWKYQKKIWLILGSIIAAHMVILFTIIYSNNWEATLRPTPESMYNFTVMTERQWHVILGSYYANLPGFVIGLGLGYIYYKYKDRNIFDSKLKVTIWWILTWGQGLGIIVGPGLIIYSRGYQHNRLYAAIYGCISRTVFSAGIGLAMLGMTQGIGWGVRWTSEWAPTYVLGRLTYSAYLTHTIVMRSRVGSRRHLTYITDSVVFSETIIDIFLGYLLALFLTLLFELPMSELQKWIVPQQNKERNKAPMKIQNGVNAKKIS